MKDASIAISIVIPIYNVEKYLTECLESCVKQTLKNIEIICVNDCSPDNSRAIAESFAKRNNRIKIIDHEKNTRQGGARNTGVKHARGEYVWFVDSDDFIAENACQVLYDSAKKHDVDILCFEILDFICEEQNPKKYIYKESGYFTNWQKNTTIFMQKDATKLNADFSVVPWQYITRCDYLKQFAFRENCVWEDTDFTAILFASCNTLRCIPFTAYYYRVRQNSTVHSLMTLNKLLDLLAADIALEKFIKQKRLPRKHFVRRFYDRHICWVENEFLRNKEIVKNSEECKKALKLITPIARRANGKEFFYKLRTLPLRDKIFVIYWHAKNLLVKKST